MTNYELVSAFSFPGASRTGIDKAACGHGSVLFLPVSLLFDNGLLSARKPGRIETVMLIVDLAIHTGAVGPIRKKHIKNKW